MTLPVGCDVSARVKVVEVPASETLKVVFDRVIQGSVANADTENTVRKIVMREKKPIKIEGIFFINCLYEL